MPEDSPVVDQKRHPVRRASCASTRLTRERMVCQRRHLLARCCGLLATGVRDAPGARKFNARSDRSNRRQPFICSWTTLNAPTPRILITRRWDDGLAPFNNAACYLPRIRVPAARFPPAETRTRGKTQFNLPCAPIGKYDSIMCQVSGHLGCNDQNSAGRYPLISRPTHTSTSVGVVHNMSALPLWLWGRDPFILKAPPPP
jgi:hypothetical protein